MQFILPARDPIERPAAEDRFGPYSNLRPNVASRPEADDQAAPKRKQDLP
jgi:hypothetical protein